MILCVPSANGVFGVNVSVVALYVAATAAPSTYNTIELASAGIAPTLNPGVVSSVEVAVEFAFVIVPALSS